MSDNAAPAPIPAEAPTGAPDFSAYFLNETAAVPITMPNGMPMMFGGQPVIVRVFSPATPQYADAKDALDREATARLMSSIGAKPVGRDAQDRDADARFLTAVTQCVDNFPFPGGHAAMYRESRLRYIADQVRTHLNDLGNFFPASAQG